MTQWLALAVATLMLTGCFENMVFEAIEKNPKKFFESVKKAEDGYKKILEKEHDEQMKAALEEEFKNPKSPDVGGNRVTFGNDSAPITIVEYSDFQCPVCSRAVSTLDQVKNEYGDKVRVIYKHVPLRQIHPFAEMAAKYYEAIAMQDHEKAKKFHDIMFDEQYRMGNEKEDFFKDAAKKVGANMSKLAKDIKSDSIMETIKADEAEFRKFGFTGTPGFLVNGISVMGAYPFSHFKKIIDRHLNK